MSSSPVIVDADGETAHLNFSQLLYRYTRPLVQADIEVALQYLYLVCLNADLPGTLGKEQVALCHDYIRETVMETRKYAELLGDLHADGTRTVRSQLPTLIPRTDSDVCSLECLSETSSSST
jgi:nuclear pore complex protein Nup93